MRVFHTAVVAQTQPANVTSGLSASLDFQMVSLRATSQGAPGDPIQLATFVVGTSKEMDGSAIAINTQRFAPNVMSVVSTDEYTGMTEGGVGELLKAVAGMNVDIGGGGEPYLISMNGVPPGNVPISVGGFALANGAAGTSRQVGIEQISMNNMSRIGLAERPPPRSRSTNTKKPRRALGRRGLGGVTCRRV